MSNQLDRVNKAFSRKSLVYEDYGKSNEIVRWSRKRVYHHFLKQLDGKAQILELNGGTGEDALFFARLGHDVHIIELSDGMIQKIGEKIGLNVPGNIEYTQTSYTNLGKVEKRFDAIYSNFGGLNLTPDLGKVFMQFPRLLKPGGKVTLVMLSRFCIWEFISIFWGIKTALRRLPSFFGVPVKSKVSGEDLHTYYYSVKDVISAFPKEFELVNIESLCSLVPPSYFNEFPTRFPNLFGQLKKMEVQFRNLSSLINLGDFFILTMVYNPGGH